MGGYGFSAARKLIRRTCATGTTWERIKQRGVLLGNVPAAPDPGVVWLGEQTRASALRRKRAPPQIELN